MKLPLFIAHGQQVLSVFAVLILLVGGGIAFLVSRASTHFRHQEVEKEHSIWRPITTGLILFVTVLLAFFMVI